MSPFLNKPCGFEGVQMGARDTALTPASEISLAAAPHLFDTPGFEDAIRRGVYRNAEQRSARVQKTRTYA